MNSTASQTWFCFHTSTICMSPSWFCIHSCMVITSPSSACKVIITYDLIVNEDVIVNIEYLLFLSSNTSSSFLPIPPLPPRQLPYGPFPLAPFPAPLPTWTQFPPFQTSTSFPDFPLWISQPEYGPASICTPFPLKPPLRLAISCHKSLIWPLRVWRMIIGIWYYNWDTIGILQSRYDTVGIWCGLNMILSGYDTVEIWYSRDIKFGI